ncbi:carboxymethyltransferase [Scheffersomyces stipitis CBS 6054]|uniref:tRNA wybutosine-synthesizing protein 4 n=1 Tax=Scheffersomyces stipitis (strain ATCC 58785 / CBS 6054 / NBRC 10063 / NRRL Y-11545) TaxID=322104 RepID=A3GFJ9_PICST|nr:carboxymethyltransferase [Scheffersomyces stipitis CBS 6054]EAZ63361.2 carboxymethyltransferase [Scheffersomyces stipitis CBS 6054]
MTAKSKPELDASQLARQRKKIEKDRRRKQYDDLQVQGTNNSSIVSKRSVEMLYTNKLEPEMGEWFKHFVKKGKRRSPAINRGYWIRMETIKQMVTRIIKNNPNKKVHIINLGCGFDPLPFQLLSLSKNKGENVDLHFIDIDYPDLVQNKLKMIYDSPEILEVIGELQNPEKDLGLFISAEKYKLVGCDLKDTTRYQKQLDYLVGTSSDSIKIFVAEVSLAYMKPEFADPVIDYSSRVSNSHFLILEQILPNTEFNAFATKMMYHFNHLRSPLQCVQTYPLKEDQITRFNRYYPLAEVRNLFENWLCLIDDNMKERVEHIEEFDEWEEFIIFCQHYVIVHATNMKKDQLIYADSDSHQAVSHDYDFDDNVKLTLDTRANPEFLELKFPAITTISGNQILVHGGLRQTRSNLSYIYDSVNGNVSERIFTGEVPPRMCHTLTALSDTTCVLIGGRTRPGMALNDTYKLQGDEWVKLKDIPNGRCRHAATRLSESEVLIFGGLPENKEHCGASLFEVYDINMEESRPLKIVQNGSEATIANLKSCGIAYNGQYGLIIGGMEKETVPTVNNQIYKFTIGEDRSSIHITSVAQGDVWMRIGSQVQFVGENKVVVIGGISPRHVFSNFSNIVTYNVETQEIRCVEIPESITKTSPPIFIGFGSGVLVDEKGRKSIALLGGGAVCYSFGSCYNGVYRLEL